MPGGRPPPMSRLASRGARTRGRGTHAQRLNRGEPKCAERENDWRHGGHKRAILCGPTHQTQKAPTKYPRNESISRRDGSMFQPLDRHQGRNPAPSDSTMRVAHCMPRAQCVFLERPAQADPSTGGAEHRARRHWKPQNSYASPEKRFSFHAFDLNENERGKAAVLEQLSNMQ